MLWSRGCDATGSQSRPCAQAACSRDVRCPTTGRAVGGQLRLLRQRTPIQEVLQSDNTNPQTRESLQQVLEIRRFATSELGLPDNGSYNTYVDLGRPYVVWNVVAAEEFSVEPMTWCFPFRRMRELQRLFRRRGGPPLLGGSRVGWF